MGEFRLNITTDNAAFDPPAPELARILRKIADQLDGDLLPIDVTVDGEPLLMFQTILDVNGNDVGRFALKPESYYA